MQRSLLLRSAAATAVAAASLLVSVAQPAQAAAVKEDKIPAALDAQFAAKSEADYWIRFGAKADLSKASAIAD